MNQRSELVSKIISKIIYRKTRFDSGAVFAAIDAFSFETV